PAPRPGRPPPPPPPRSQRALPSANSTAAAGHPFRQPAKRKAMVVFSFGDDGHSGSRARVSSVAGWAGSSSRVAIAATALTPAATRQAALKPWKNALEAAAWTAFASAGLPLTLPRLARASAPPTELW